MRVIELYKKRNLNGILSDSMSFIQQNARVLFTNLALLLLPLALIGAYFALRTMNVGTEIVNAFTTGDYQPLMEIGVYYIVNMFITLVTSSVVFTVCSIIMLKYASGELMPKAGLGSLQPLLVPYTLKTILTFLLLLLITGAVGAIFGLLCIISPWFLILVFFVLILLSITLSLSFFPIYFKNAGIVQAISEGWKIGWQKKGTTFVIILIASLMVSIISSFFSIPFYIYYFSKLMLFSNPAAGMEGVVPVDAISYITYCFATFGSYLMTPFYVIPLAFHYCSAREESEGLSMNSEVDQFETME